MITATLRGTVVETGGTIELRLVDVPPETIGGLLGKQVLFTQVSLEHDTEASTAPATPPPHLHRASCDDSIGYPDRPSIYNHDYTAEGNLP